MGDFNSEKRPLPSAPGGEDEGSSSSSHSTVPPPAPMYPQAVPLQQTVPSNVTVPSNGGGQGPPPPPGFHEPPPSYQAAMSYPAQPEQNPGYPKQPGFQIPPGYSPYPPPPPAAAPIHTNIGGYHTMPMPNAIPDGSQQHRPVVVHVVQQAPGGLQCAHCAHGTVVRETDMCCLLCLILLAIFTFPFGLVFLCCVPCTVHRKCNSCNRVG